MNANAPIIALVVAIAENGVIGRAGTLPWRMPSDLKLFRRTTMGKPLIMGRKTFASLKKPLDGRDNIVLTRDMSFQPPTGVDCASNFDAALTIARGCAAKRGAHEIMVIGGAEVFRLALPSANRLYLTRIHGHPEGDAHFPLTDFAGWDEIAREPGVCSDKDEFPFTFTILQRA
jgi:dihydrofolate reductase